MNQGRTKRGQRFWSIYIYIYIYISYIHICSLVFGCVDCYTNRDPEIDTFIFVAAGAVGASKGPRMCGCGTFLSSGEGGPEAGGRGSRGSEGKPDT